MVRQLGVGLPGNDVGDRAQRRHRLVVHGDFSCPWSYLASRRAVSLAAEGVQVDWRAVERDPLKWGHPPDTAARFARLRDEMTGIAAALLPGEHLAYALAGFLPHTRAAVTGYAEAYGCALAAQVRHPLFEALWLHGVDLADPRVVRTLLIDLVRSGSSPDEPLWAWGSGTDRSGGPVTATARRLVGRWQREWRAAGAGALPMVEADGAEPLHGRAAIDWLGAAVLEQGGR